MNQKLMICLVFLGLLSISLNIPLYSRVSMIKNNLKYMKNNETFIEDFQKVLTYSKIINIVDASDKTDADFNKCPILTRVETKDFTFEQLYYYYSIAFEHNCKLKIPKAIKEKIKKNMSSKNFKEFYQAFTIGNLYLLFESEEEQAICQNTIPFLDNSGAAKIKQKSREGSFTQGAQLYEIIYFCFERVKLDELHSQLKQALEKPIKGLIENSQQIANNELAILENKSFISVTGLNAYQLIKLNYYLKSEQITKAYYQYFNFLKNAYYSTMNHEDLYATMINMKLFNFNYQFNLEHNAYPSNYKNYLSGTIGNLYNSDDVDSSVRFLASIYQNNKKVVSDISINYQKKQSKWVSEKPIQIMEPGIYDIIFESEYGIFKFALYQKFSIFQNSDHSNVKYAIVQVENSKDTPKFTANELKYGSDLQITAEPANSNQYIHIKFQMEGYPSKLDMLGISLQNVNELSQVYYIKNEKIQKNKNFQTVYVAIDLGKPEHIKPINGTYDLAIIIADAKIEKQIQWKIATFDLTFQRKLQNGLESTTDYIPQKEIFHIFKADPEEPLPAITLSFVALMIIIFIIFFIFLNKINIEFQSPSTCAFLFILCLFGFAGILTMFWIKFKILKVLVLCLGLTLATIIIGNKALVYLFNPKPSEAKEKVD